LNEEGAFGLLFCFSSPVLELLTLNYLLILVMRFSVEYVNDLQGKAKAVQIPVAEWEKLLLKLKQYEEAFALRSKLSVALQEVEKMKGTKESHATLSDLLDEL
jgi:hypothetical protein